LLITNTDKTSLFLSVSFTFLNDWVIRNLLFISLFIVLQHLIASKWLDNQELVNLLLLYFCLCGQPGRSSKTERQLSYVWTLKPQCSGDKTMWRNLVFVSSAGEHQGKKR
jgi:hypothetical protein